MKRALTALALVTALMSVAPAFAQQFARPDGTVLPGGSWTAVNAPTLHEATDEATPDDTDYMEATQATTDELTLTDVSDPLSGIGHTIRFRMWTAGSGAKERVQIQLYQGTTQIAVTGNEQSRGAWGQFSYTLTVLEADAITDYSDLRVRVVSLMDPGETARMIWVEFEVPDALPGSPPTLSSPTATAIDTTSATLGATIDTGGPLLARGHVWNTTAASRGGDERRVDGGGDVHAAGGRIHAGDPDLLPRVRGERERDRLHRRRHVLHRAEPGSPGSDLLAGDGQQHADRVDVGRG
jgi:hypothetical protein